MIVSIASPALVYENRASLETEYEPPANSTSSTPHLKSSAPEIQRSVRGQNSSAITNSTSGERWMLTSFSDDVALVPGASLNFELHGEKKKERSATFLLID